METVHQTRQDLAHQKSPEGLVEYTCCPIEDFTQPVSEAKADNWWSHLSIGVPDSARKYLDRPLDGSWQLHSECGTAQNMLHRKQPTAEDEGLPPLYLFLDPTRTGEPVDDCAVFSIDHSRLDFGVVRPIVATLDSS